MDSVVAGESAFDPVALDTSSVGHRLQVVLERAESTYLRAAARLRTSGHHERAQRIERYAGWARFDLDEPIVARQLYTRATRLRYTKGLENVANLALEHILSLARAERGNVQFADPVSGALRIVAHHGFDAEFLDHFAVVKDDLSVCGRAAKRAAQVIVSDVITDKGFEPHRSIARASGFRAVQSTPLVDKTGHLVGVVSTHYPIPYAPSPRDLRIIGRYADLIGHIMSSRVSAETLRPAAGVS